MDESESDLTDYLRQLFEDHSNRSLHLRAIIVADGPYRIVVEYLRERDLGNWQLSSARGFLLAQWAKTVCSVYCDPADAEDAAEDTGADDLARTLGNMLTDPRWLETNR